MMKIKRLFFVIAGCLAAGYAAADAQNESTTPMYSIEALDIPASSFRYGPFAVSMGEGESPDVAGLYEQFDFFSFFNLPPHQVDLGQKMYRHFSCRGNRISSSYCDALWDGANMAKAWRYSLYNGTPNLKSFLNQTIADDTDVIYTSLGNDASEGVGYRYDYDSSLSSYANPTSYGIAKFNNKTFILKSPVIDREYGNILGSYASALGFVKLDDGRILVGGYSNFPSAKEQFFYNCYAGNDNSDGSYHFCPGHKMQATIWVIDPDRDPDGAEITGQQTQSYIDYTTNPTAMVSAAVTSFIKKGDDLYALGYSVTNDWGGAVNPSNTAVYWKLGLDGDKVNYKTVSEYPGMARPGNQDNWNEYTWTVGANANGYILANRKLAKAKNSNYAMNLAYTRLRDNRSFDNISYPLYNYPFGGVNSEGAAINDNNFIVGWIDRRDDTRAIVGGSYRDSEALFYDINAGKYHYINDFICHKDAAGNTDCKAEDGKYYHIQWAVDINNSNVIYATAFQYASKSDWDKSINATVKSVLLKPSEDAFIVDGDTGEQIVNESRKVTYNRAVVKNYSTKRGGSLGIGGLIMLIAASCFTLSGRRKF